MSATSAPLSIHHINFPTTDTKRTEEWYGKVFGMERINVSQWTPDTVTLLLTRGNFDLHFTPVDEMVDMGEFHFAIEVEDWDGFIAHLESLEIPYAEPVERPQNRSKFSYIRDPDGTIVEFVYHADHDSWRA